jgi:hypothetical protein
MKYYDHTMILLVVWNVRKFQNPRMKLHNQL